MRWATKHRAGAVNHQHKIGDIDRVLRAGKGVDGLEAGIKAPLLGLFDGFFGGAELAAFFDEIREFRVQSSGRRRGTRNYANSRIKPSLP